jgi:hypothetical protein
MRFAIVSVFVVTLAGAGCSGTSGAAAAASNAVGTTGADAASSDAKSGASNAPAPASAADAGRASVEEREITIPSGTTLPVILDTPVASDTSRVEQRVNAHLARAIVVHGATALPAGSHVSGVVTDARRSGKVKGLAHVAVRFDSVSPRGEDERYAMRTAAVGRTAPSTKKKDALEIGAPAAGGALIGAIVGGKKGAAVGGAVGGGAGTAVVLSTRGKEVRLAKGTALTLKLAAPLTVKVRG